MRVGVRLLGAFEVVVDGVTVPADRWRRRPAAALVKLLALQPQARLLRDQVVDALWPDLLLEEAAPRLHKAAHYARVALGRRDGIVISGGTVALFPGHDLTSDVAAFEVAAARALEAGDRGQAREAAGLYGGDLLPDDLYEPWTTEARSRLRVRHLALLTLAGDVEALVAADPLDEAAHLALVRGHVEAGRRLPALAALDRMTEVFERELGEPPGPAAAELRERALALPVEVPSPPAGSGGVALPAPRRRLIGRDADLTAVTALLSTHRVVTVTGPGGMGKTSLALAVGRAVAADGRAAEVLLADLAPARDAAGVVRAVAEATGVQGQGALRVDTLAASLAHRDVLLILDNCEHLIDASADLVDAVLDAGPSPRLLLTSREPLRVDGEAEHRLRSLGAGSVELFLERAAVTAGPGIVLADDPRVSDLCERLDGLPLAIELAAGQLRHLTMAEVAARLDDRLDLLVAGRPRAGERHSTLTATIEWSHRLLAPEGRRAFERLGVFPSGFDLEAARAVVLGDDPGDVAPLVGDLVAKSLLVHDPDRGRYRLLETIRIFAAHRLQHSGEEAGARQRLRRHFVGRATAQPRVQSWLSTALAARSRDDLDSVRLAFEDALAADDLSEAVDLALSLSTLWRNAVSYAEGRRWVERLEDRDLGTRDRVWTSILSADVALGAGDARQMRAAARRARTLSAEIGDDGATVIALVYDAMVHLVDPDRASSRLEEAAGLAAATGEPGLERLARGFRLVARLLAGDTEGLSQDAAALTDEDEARDYASYLSKWGASVVAMVGRDGAWLGRLLTRQRADLRSTGLHENWLTIYWEALALIARGEPAAAQLRHSQVRAEAEGRSVDADCVLALAYAAACAEEWERAAELLGATWSVMLADTAGYIHHRVLAEQLVRPHLDSATYAAALARGRRLQAADVLAEHGLG